MPYAVTIGFYRPLPVSIGLQAELDDAESKLDSTEIACDGGEATQAEVFGTVVAFFH